MPLFENPIGTYANLFKSQTKRSSLTYKIIVIKYYDLVIFLFTCNQGILGSNIVKSRLMFLAFLVNIVIVPHMLSLVLKYILKGMLMLGIIV